MLAKFIAWGLKIAAGLSSLFWISIGILAIKENDIQFGIKCLIIAAFCLVVIVLPLQRWINDALKAR